MSDKQEIYWQGFADGQRDIESQISMEEDVLDPNDFVESLDEFAGWTLSQLENNGSDEIDDEGRPMFANYGTATQSVLAMAFAYTRILRILSDCLFKLNQGDFTEEHFHHEIEIAMEQLNQESPLI